jgi:formyl-CoA transferase
VEKSEFYANARTDLSGPLSGIRVLEVTTTWAGPMAGCILADLGADVIKLEHPDGEVGRVVPPRLPHSELTVFNETVNRNKRNISLDLHQARGRELFLELCRSIDIVLENFKPGTLSSWGCGYSDVRQVKPDIIYVSVSGFGQFGPYSARPGYDPIAQNFTGWSSMNGPPEGGPTKAPTFLADDLGGINGAIGALAALQHRHHTGEGQHVDVALVDGLIFQSNGYLTSGALGIPNPRMGNQFAIAAPVNVYECKDGRVYGGVLLDSHWKALSVHIGHEALASMGALERIENREQVDRVVADWCREHTTTEVVNQFSELGLAITRVNTYAEASADPHVHARDMLQTTTLTDGSVVPLTGPAIKFSRTPTRVRHAAPALGQDNAEVYGALGLSEDDLTGLREDRVI